MIFSSTFILIFSLKILYQKSNKVVSPASYNSTEQMGKVTIRTGLTSQGSLSMNPWLGDYSSYDYSTINKGTNPISKLEVVSSLNFFNLGHWEYHFNYQNCTQKYNPKLYLGAVQIVGETWNYDRQTGQTNGLPDLPRGSEKSGS